MCGQLKVESHRMRLVALPQQRRDQTLNKLGVFTPHTLCCAKLHGMLRRFRRNVPPEVIVAYSSYDTIRYGRLTCGQKLTGWPA